MKKVLNRGQALVRWLQTDHVSEDGWKGLATLLDEAERERARRFHFDHDRQCFIAAHALTRATLSSFIERRPDALRFTIGDFGKPEVALQPHEPRIRFNLSHTRGIATVAITLNDDIGVDVEWMRRGGLTRELALEIFAPAECQIIEACKEEELNEMLFTLWTLKEAYMKATGKGLSIPLKDFALALDPPSLSIPAIRMNDKVSWLLRCYRPTPEHAMALALQTFHVSQYDVVIDEVAAEDLLTV